MQRVLLTKILSDRGSQGDSNNMSIKDASSPTTIISNRMGLIPAENASTAEPNNPDSNGNIPPLNGRGIKFAHLNIHSLILEFQILENQPFSVICLNETSCDSSINDL